MGELIDGAALTVVEPGDGKKLTAVGTRQSYIPKKISRSVPQFQRALHNLIRSQ